MSRRVADRPFGETVPSQFRLGAPILAELDGLVESFSAETGNRETRTSVLRQLIHREHVRRAKGRAKA